MSTFVFSWVGIACFHCGSHVLSKCFVVTCYSSMQKYCLNIMRVLPEFTEIEWLPCERNTKLNHFEQCVLQEKLALGNREYCQLCHAMSHTANWHYATSRHMS